MFVGAVDAVEKGELVGKEVVKDEGTYACERKRRPTMLRALAKMAIVADCEMKMRRWRKGWRWIEEVRDRDWILDCSKWNSSFPSRRWNLEFQQG